MDHHDPDFLQKAAEARARIRELPVDALGDQTLIDVRSAEEYVAGHLPGAVNIPLEALRAEADRLRGRTVVCYCNGGNRGALAADALQQAGHTAVYSLAGGLRAAAVHLTPVRTGDPT